jgi:hypothetical protein
MTDRYIPFEAFNISELSDALDTESRTTRDVAHGWGEAMTLGESMTELQIYPAAGVVRATSEAASLELHRVPGYTVQDETVVYFEPTAETERTRLTVNTDGEISLRSLAGATAAPEAKPTDTPPTGETSSQNASQSPTEPTQTPSAGGPESEDRRTITFSGQLGRDPWFKQDGDELVSGFPVAENHNGAPTIWYDVVTRGELAKHIQDSFATTNKDTVITSGQPVEVTGHHELKPGTKRAKPDLLATSVTRISRDEYKKRRLSPPRG